MTVWRRQGEPDSSRKRRAKGALAIVLARDRSLGAIERERACTASRATTGAQLGSGCACAPPRIRAAHSHIDTDQLASAAPSHSSSADKHPQTPTGGREAGAEGTRSLGRKRAWGGRVYGAEASLGRQGVWGGREAGAEGRLGRKGVWGGREPGAEGSMGR